MIIILEGPDGGGKSTLAGKLVKDLNAKYYHSGGPKTKSEMDMVINELEIMAHSKSIIIVDRVPWISEMVYPYAFGRKPVLSVAEYLQHLKLPQKIIYCKPSGPAQMSLDYKEHKPKEHTESVIKNHERIADLYDALFKRIPHIRYDFYKTNYKILKDKLCAD